jgi:hypothetical protein
MVNDQVVVSFHAGDEVVLARGPNVGTPGIFQHLCADTRWANILERNNFIKNHPLEWIERAETAGHSLNAQQPSR